MACSDQINSQELENAKDDAITLAEIATSRLGGSSGGTLIDSSTTRLGDTFATARGQLEKLGYEPPIAYASGISFTVNDGAKTVEENGVIYAPLISSLPFTTSGTFAGDDDTRFRVVQGGTQRDFADYAALQSIDTSLYFDGYTVTVTGEGIAGDFVLRNIVGHGLASTGITRVINADWYAFRIYSGYLQAEWFGAVGDEVTDDTSAISASVLLGNVIGIKTYKTSFTEKPNSLIGTGKIILESPARKENITKNENQSFARLAPSGFSYVPSRKIICEAVGAASHGIDLLRQFEQDFSAYFGVSEYWVDPINGSDASSGSVFSPFRTVKAACQASAAGTIRLKEGVYTDRFFIEYSDNIVGGSFARPIKIIGLGDVVFRAEGDQPSELTWSLDPTYSAVTYSATPSGSETVNSIVWNHSGEEILLPYYSLGGDLSSVSFGWYQDVTSKEIHIKIGGFDVDVEKSNLEIMYSRGQSIGLSGAATYLENIKFRGDSQFSCVHDGSGNRPTLYHKNCTYEYLEGANVHSQGARIFSQNVISRYAMNGDGFNYYDESFPISGGQATEALEVDCEAYSNGIPVTNLDSGDPSIPNRVWDTNRNKQGSSGHDNSVICRINGTYYNNFGQNIADTGAGSKTWMVGSACRDVYAELYASGLYGRYMGVWTEGDSFLDTVSSKGETLSYGFFNQSGVSKHFNPDYEGFNNSYALVSGTIDCYTPDLP